MHGPSSFEIEQSALKFLCEKSGFAKEKFSHITNFPINEVDFKNSTSYLIWWFSAAFILCELKRYGKKSFIFKNKYDSPTTVNGSLLLLIKELSLFLVPAFPGAKLLKKLLVDIGLQSEPDDRYKWPALSIAYFANGDVDKLPEYNPYFFENLQSAWCGCEFDPELEAKLLLLANMLEFLQAQKSDDQIYELAIILAESLSISPELLQFTGKDESLDNVLAYSCKFVERPGCKGVVVERPGIAFKHKSSTVQLLPVVLRIPPFADVIAGYSPAQIENIGNHLGPISKSGNVAFHSGKFNHDQKLLIKNLINQENWHPDKKAGQSAFDQQHFDKAHNLILKITDKVQSLGIHFNINLVVDLLSLMQKQLLFNANELKFAEILSFFLNQILNMRQSAKNNPLDESVQKNLHEINLDLIKLSSVFDIEFDLKDLDFDPPGDFELYEFNDHVPSNKPFVKSIGWTRNNQRIQDTIWALSAGVKPKAFDDLAVSLKDSTSLWPKAKPVFEKWQEMVARGIFEIQIAPLLVEAIFSDHNQNTNPAPGFIKLQSFLNDCLAEQAGLEFFKIGGGSLGNYSRKEVEAINPGQRMNIVKLVCPGLRYVYEPDKIFVAAKVEVD